MTRTIQFWSLVACTALGGMVLGGMADRANASSRPERAIAWETFPLTKLKQTPPAIAQAPVESPAVTPESQPAPPFELPPELIEDSPLLQRWLEEIPNVQRDIRNDPAFRPRLRAGYADIDGDAGFHLGLDDVFVQGTALTLSAEYQGTFDNEREQYGGDLRYYVLPLGSVVNVAPVVGYRRLNLDNDEFAGLHAGLRAVLVLSRTGAADIALTQSWIAPGTDDEVGLTTLSLGYAVSDRLRLSTDIQAQNSPASKDSRFGIGLEWML